MKRQKRPFGKRFQPVANAKSAGLVKKTYRGAT
jgi:hypothetical protein